MLIATRRRRGLARFGAVMAIASALAIALTGAPANAAVTPNASGAVSPAGVIVNGTYRWDDANSAKCLACDTESRGAARQEACDNGDNTISWDAVNTSGNNYELIDEHNGQCLSIAGGSGADGAAAFVFTCAGTNDQIFTLVPAPRRSSRAPTSW
jgi:hypothetical protein